MADITTTSVDVSIEKLAGYVEKLETLKSKNQSEISNKLEEINGLLDDNVGKTSYALKTVNTNLDELRIGIVDLISETQNTLNSISKMFCEVDAKSSDAISNV